MAQTRQTAQQRERTARTDFVFWLNHACRELPKGHIDGLRTCVVLLAKFDACARAIRRTERERRTK